MNASTYTYNVRNRCVCAPGQVCDRCLWGDEFFFFLTIKVVNQKSLQASNLELPNAEQRGNVASQRTKYVDRGTQFQSNK